MENKYQLNNVAFKYDKKYILKELNLNIPKNKITVLLGGNGSGKSTLIKNLAGILNYQGGSIYLDNTNLSTFSKKSLAKKLAYMPQVSYIQSDISVYEFLKLGRFPFQNAFCKLSNDDLNVIKEMIELCNLEELLDFNINDLSGGQRQRVFLALALIQNDELLLLDEPATYLDIKYQLELIKLLKKINKEKQTTIIVVMHDLNQAMWLADYIVGLKNGEIIDCINKDSVNSEFLKKIFGIDLKFEKKQNHYYIMWEF